MTGFIIYAVCCALFYVLALYAFVSSKPVGLWSRGRRQPKVKNVRGYNRAVAKLFLAYGTLLLLSGIPTILEINPIAAMMISTTGISAASIMLFLAGIKIESKYRDKN